MSDVQLPPKFDMIKHADLVSLIHANGENTFINGEQVIRDTNGRLVEHVVMDYNYFKDYWLSQFAIGRVGERNYFDLKHWAELTENFVKSVLIVNEEKQPLFIIPKLTRMVINSAQQQAMTEMAGIAGQARYIPDEAEKEKLVNWFAGNVQNVLGEEVVHLSTFIPKAVFDQNNIIPTVLQQVIYIRDYYTRTDGKPFGPEDEELKRVEKIMVDNYHGRNITQSDRDFINKITNNEFVFNVPGEDVNVDTPEERQVFDPFVD